MAEKHLAQCNPGRALPVHQEDGDKGGWKLTTLIITVPHRLALMLRPAHWNRLQADWPHSALLCSAASN